MTTAQPHFKEDEPEIVYKGDEAEIMWSVSNLDSVTYVIIDVCVIDTGICNPSINITSPEKQPYLIPLPVGDTKKYVYIFTFYDRMDVVYKTITG
jgi:hypothetical protein